MTEQKEIQCEYCTVRSNENKCKALEIEFHNCLNILEQKKCPIYKLKQQLQKKEQESEELKTILQTSDIVKAVISSAEINFPIIEKLSNALNEIEEFCKQVLQDNKEAYINVDYILSIINNAKKGN